MADSAWRLKERTVVLAGPLSILQQSIAKRLTEYGADVALLDADTRISEKFASQLMDQREVNEQYGRIIAIKYDPNSYQSIREAVSRTAESFGGVDVYIDNQIPFSYGGFAETEAVGKIEGLVKSHFISSLWMSHSVLEFFRGRKRGRMIFLMGDAAMNSSLEGEALNAAARSGLIGFAKALSRELLGHNVTVNCVSVGLTEESLMARFPQSGTINLAKENLVKSWPQARLVEPDDLAQFLCFLSSPHSNCLTGEVIRVPHSPSR